ncbi:T6SS effector amidase Tae4 family protein [Intestinirhabdus alba]|jgi:hypothetical protein|uniref:Type VI secretion system amidase effector protein Tae4 n=1 Tax=Intestinirhabdus alba TaxID=2899544 RepID=A0A6L6ISF1_9ENTR|nr:T6SS effector amidase Tae4 family protein [Intestinirhabdus alba]MTH48877.1 hypothetical protein [Intestinirhabdus alba]
MAVITARSGNSSSSLNVKRPSWSSVYAGYPKTNAGTDYEDDLRATEVFTSIFGYGYDTTIYTNACGTRVSLALLSAGMNRVGSRKIMISEVTHPHYGKFIEPGAARLKEFLVAKWGNPEKSIASPADIESVARVLDGKKGIYIMIPKLPGVFGASGHATLWTGKRVMGDHHYISDNTHAVYFWELK